MFHRLSSPDVERGSRLAGFGAARRAGGAVDRSSEQCVAGRAAIAMQTAEVAPTAAQVAATDAARAQAKAVTAWRRCRRGSRC